MRNTIAKRLRRSAEVETEGKTIAETRKTYKRMKREYKDHKQGKV